MKSVFAVSSASARRPLEAVESAGRPLGRGASGAYTLSANPPRAASLVSSMGGASVTVTVVAAAEAAAAGGGAGADATGTPSM
jgi:TPP-dependent indolepyruvate ferredoxin oxidoreductase alpha subunit